MMSSPERFLAVPAYVIERHTGNISKLNGCIYIPKLARFDMGNIFDGWSLCLMGHLAEMEDGATAVPKCVVYTDREGVFSDPDGRMLRYEPNCKSVKLDNEGADTQRVDGRAAHSADSLILRCLGQSAMHSAPKATYPILTKKISIAMSNL